MSTTEPITGYSDRRLRPGVLLLGFAEDLTYQDDECIRVASVHSDHIVASRVGLGHQSRWTLGGREWVVTQERKQWRRRDGN